MPTISLKEDGSLPSKVLYYTRGQFKDLAYGDLPRDVFNQPDRYINTVEERNLVHPFYGRIDGDGDAIYPKAPTQDDPSSTFPLIDNPKYKELIDRGVSPELASRALRPTVPSISQIRNSEVSKSVFAFRFVVKALFEMNSYFKDGLLTRQLEENGIYSQISPVKGYANFQEKYSEHIDTVFQNYFVYLKTNYLESSIINVKDFSDRFIEYLQASTDDTILTLSKYLLSPHASPSISGLNLSLYIDDFNNDLNKFNTYIKANNFNFFLECCTRFGFMVNKDAPWEIYFHFASPAAKEYIKMYGLEDENDVYNKLYQKAYLKDISFLSNALVKYYNEFAKANPDSLWYDQKGSCRSLNIKKVQRSFISYDQYRSYITDKKLLKMYFEIRLIEDKIDIGFESKKAYFNLFNQKLKYAGMDAALFDLNKFFIQRRPTIDLRTVQSY
jgi:hypothetical protein